MLKDSEDADQYRALIPMNYTIKISVLIIDDDISSLRSVTLALQETSYKVTAMQSPEAALNAIQERPCRFDAVLLRTPLKDIDCIIMMNLVQSINAEIVVVLMMYGKPPDFDLTERALRNGAAFVLHEPFTKSGFQNIWQHILHRRSDSLNIKTSEQFAAQNHQNNDPAIDRKRKGKEIWDGRKDDRFMSNQWQRGKQGSLVIREPCSDSNVIGKKVKVEQGTTNIVDQRKNKGVNQQDNVTQADNTRQVRVWNPELLNQSLNAWRTDNQTATAGKQTVYDPNLGQLQVASHLQNQRSEVIQQPNARTTLAGTSIPRVSVLQNNNRYVRAPQIPISGDGAQTCYVGSKPSSQAQTSRHVNATSAGLSTASLGFGTGAGSTHLTPNSGMAQQGNNTGLNTVGRGFGTGSGISGSTHFMPNSGLARQGNNTGLNTVSRGFGTTHFMPNSGLARQGNNTGLNTVSRGFGTTHFMPNSGLAQQGNNTGLNTVSRGFGTTHFMPNSGLTRQGNNTGLNTPSLGFGGTGPGNAVATHLTPNSGLGQQGNNTGLNTASLGFGTGAGNAGTTHLMPNSGLAQQEINTSPINLQSTIMQTRNAYNAQRIGNSMQSNGTTNNFSFGNGAPMQTAALAQPRITGTNLVLNNFRGQININIYLPYQRMSEMQASQGVAGNAVFPNVGTSTEQLQLLDDDDAILDELYHELFGDED